MIWLLRCTIAGRVWYLASRGCAPVKDGVALAHYGTLSVSGFADGLRVTGGIGGPNTADVSFHLGDVEWWDLVNAGHRFDRATAELSLWREGLTYAERVILVSGGLSVGEAIPQRGEPLDATIYERTEDQAVNYPDASDVVTATAWPNALDSDDGQTVIGEPYSWPLGVLGPYVDDNGTLQSVSTTPVLIVDTTGGAEVGCIAGAPVGAATVVIWNRTDRNSATFAVSTTIDGDGKPRATVSFAAAPGGWVFDGSEELYVKDWKAGGLISSRTQNAVRGLGDALVFLLEQRYGDDGPTHIDYGAWAAAAGYLNAWQVGINLESADPLDTIADLLAGLCPALYILGGPRGLRPVFLADDPREVCPLLTLGAELDQVDDAPRFANVEIVNSVTVHFAKSTAYDALRGSATIGANESTEAAASVSRHGVRSKNIDATALYDRGTAALSATDLIRMSWTNPIMLPYSARADVALGLELGRRYRITDADRNLTERQAWLMARQTADGNTWGLVFMGLW